MAKKEFVAAPGELFFFAVRNKDGEWFRRKGYGGYGATWVDDIKSARIYNKAGYARAQIAYFAKNYPSYGVPDLVVFKATEYQVVDEQARIEEQRIKAEEKAGIKRLQMKIQEKVALDKEINEAQVALDRARAKRSALE
jgi:hypothetical protein